MKSIITILFLLIISSVTLSAQGKVGINIASPLEVLDVNGNFNLRGTLKLNSVAGTSGQVLTSQGPSTDPIWANSAYTGGGRFWATLANSVRTGTQTPVGRGVNWVLNNPSETTQEDTVDFAGVFVQGSDLTVSNEGTLENYVTVNKSGLYHFEGVVRMFVTGDVDGLVMTPRAIMKLKILKTGVVNSEVYMEEILMPLSAQPTTGFANKSYNQTIKFGIDINLESGTTVAFYGGFNQLRMTSMVPLIAMGFTSGGYISGHFMAN